MHIYIEQPVNYVKKQEHINEKTKVDAFLIHAQKNIFEKAFVAR